MTKPTFEDVLTFIEDKLWIKLYDYQKEMLRLLYKNYPCEYEIHSREENSRTSEAAEILVELLTKENQHGNHLHN